MTLKQRNQLCKKISTVLKKGKTFFLSGHENPDGDTVASELAMSSLLSRLKKSVDIYNAHPIPENLAFLPGTETIKTAKRVDRTYDAAIIFECFDGNRMGNIIDLKKQARTVINIDHHLKHSFYGDINFINPKASSNSEQLFYLFEALKLPITKNEAICLYAGIMADTGRFQYSNTNPETLRIASKLLEKGIEVHKLCEKMFTTHALPALKLLGTALLDLKFVKQGKIAYMQLAQEDFSRSAALEEHTEEIVNYGLHVPGTFVSILFRQNHSEGLVRISFRSREHADVCKLAEQFGGGGHKYASGCKIAGPLAEVVKKVLQQAEKAV